MKLFVVLLAIELSAPEKLNRSYLPPLGTKHSGRRTDYDLRTPLELPKENPTLKTDKNRYQIFSEVEAQSKKYTDEDTNIDTDKYRTEDRRSFSDIANEDPNVSTETTVYPRIGFETVAPLVSGYDTIDTQSTLPSFRYPMKGIEQRIDDFGNSGYHYGKPESIPIVAVNKNLINNYPQNAFGMYGGNPTIIKTYPEPDVELNNMFVKYVEKNHDASDLYTSEDVTDDSQNGTISTYIDPTTFRSITESPVKAVTSSNTYQINKERKTLLNKPQRPQAISDRNAVVLNYENVLTPDGYSYSFDTSNGIHKDESASTVDGVKASGSYSYTGDDGKVYSVIYTADKNGFRPRGDHLPTPPPIPEAIQKVIEQARRDKEAGIFHDGSYDEERYGHMKYQGPVNRFLQNMQSNSKIKNRNRVFDHKNIIFSKPTHMKEIKANEHKIAGYDIHEKVFERPVNDLNGRFGMKIDSSGQTRGNSLHNIMNNRRLVTSLNEQDDFKQRTIVNSTDIKYEQKMSAIKNKSHYTKSAIRNPSSYMPQYQDVNLTPRDAGYFYVPPSQIFFEGRYQDKSTDLDVALNPFSKTDIINTKPMKVSKYYYIDQRQKYNFASTEKPYGGNFYESTIQDDQLTKDLEMTSRESSIQTNTITTPKPHANTFSTNAYDITKDYQKETLFPGQGGENGISLFGLDSVNLQLSTTPMPSEKSSLNEDQYEISNPQELVTQITSTDNYPVIKGYFYEKPEVPVTFEEVTSSTYTPTFTDDVQPESISNIKVDGFGRPIHDTQLSNTANNGYFYTTPLNVDPEKPKTTAGFYNFEELTVKDKVTSPKDRLTDGPSDLDSISEQEKATTDLGNDERGRIIGEDFSRSKQPQGYNPQYGYFY